jgi:hypothetical protein
MNLLSKVFLVTIGILLYPGLLRAQTPLGPEFTPASTDVDVLLQYGAAVACDQASVCALVWTSVKPDPVLPINNARQWGRTISAGGQLSQLQLLRGDEGVDAFSPTLGFKNGFAIFSRNERQVSKLGYLLYDDRLRAHGPFIQQPFHSPAKFGDPDSIGGTGALVPTEGGFAEVGLSFDRPEAPCNDGSCLGVFLYLFDRAGHKLRDRVRVNQINSHWETAGVNSLAVDGKGNLIVTFWRIYQGTPETGTRVLVRRFSPSGDALGGEITVGADLPGNQLYSSVAAAPGGEFFVVWEEDPDPNSDFGIIYAQRFRSDGRLAGSEVLVSSDIPAQRDPTISADRSGNYFVNWNSYQEGGEDVRGRLYRHDGSPVTSDFRVNQDALFDQGHGLSAFAPNGILTVSYDSDDPAITKGERRVPVVRRYAASPGQEICGISGAEIICDLGRTGGAPEMQLAWGGGPGEVTLFGDVDGDGREDVCSYLAGEFRCNVAHEGARIGWRETFGQPGDIPLLADVDGDGKADPCVRRGNLLLCDTAHDGRAHYSVTFGHGGELPLLGDLDGDGKADLCLVEGTSWTCRLATSGVQLQFNFGRAGDSFALGDADRDGRADPCALRGGQLLCDTQHHGGPANYTLKLSWPQGARLLFGNLDGL